MPDHLTTELASSPFWEVLPTISQTGLNFSGGKVYYNFKGDAGFSVLLNNFKRNCYSEDMI